MKSYKFTGPEDSGVPGLPHVVTADKAKAYKQSYDAKVKKMRAAHALAVKAANGQPVPDLTEAKLAGHPHKQLEAALAKGVYVEDKKPAAPKEGK